MRKLVRIRLTPDDPIGELVDLWEVRSLQRDERYNVDKEEMEYLIVINKNGIGTNFNDLEIPFEDIDQRDLEIQRIQELLDNEDDVQIL